MTLARKDYAVTSKDGVVVELYCKVCGTKIAGEEGVGRYRRFVRYPAYVEMKFETEYGFHVTNLCRVCTIVAAEDEALRQEIYDADMDHILKDHDHVHKAHDKYRPKGGNRKHYRVGRMVHVDVNREGIR